MIDPWRSLAAAIVLSVVKDFKKACSTAHRLSGTVDGDRALIEAQRLLGWFSIEWADLLTEGKAKEYQRKLYQEVQTTWLDAAVNRSN